MSVNYRTAYLESYKELKLFFPFLSSFFITRPSDIVDAEYVKIDIMREGRRLAPVISDVTQRPAKTKASIYTQKEFIPPIVGESGDVSNADLIKKAFGKDEYQSAQAGYMMQLQSQIMDDMLMKERNIMRTIEFQAAQILQVASGMTLYDEAGNAAYTMDFLTKNSHFPTVTVNWSDPSSDPDSDLIALYDQIKQDSGADARNVIFGKTAWKNYLRNNIIQDKFDIRNIDAGTIAMRDRSPDVKLMGEFIVENQRFIAWAYDGYYENPASAFAVTPFVVADKVIMIPDPASPNVDLRKVFCTVPSISKMMGRDLGILPTNLNLDNRAYTARSWINDDGDQLKYEIKTRPLLIPVSIDAFGCLDTAI